MTIPLLVLFLSLFPQVGTPSRTKDLRYKVDVNAVLYEVRVTAEDGKPITGLDSSCFEVMVGGQARPVVFFQETGSRPLSLAVLLDIGSGMSMENVRKGKQLIFDLMHLLDRDDRIIIGIFGDPEEDADAEKRVLSGLYGNLEETEFLSELTSDRLQLLRALENLTVCARPSRAKLTSPSTVPPGAVGPAATIGLSMSGSNSRTGLAIDQALARLRGAVPDNRAILVISAGLPNVGEATLEHLNRDDVCLFEIAFNYRLGNILDFGFNKRHRNKIVRLTAGASFSADVAVAEVNRVRQVLKHSYLIAYRPSETLAPGIKATEREDEVEFRLRIQPEEARNTAASFRVSSRKCLQRN